MAIPHQTGADSAGDTTPTVLTARSPEDLLALAPVLLGFWPTESIVMLTFDAARVFHARLDLPPSEEQSTRTLREVEEALVRPARDHGVRRVVLLYFGADPAAADGVHRALRRGCRRAGIAIVRALFADGMRFVDLSGGGSARSVGTPYDISCHPFVVRGLVEGRITHRTREEMVRSLDPDPAGVARVAEALAGQGLVSSTMPGDRRSVLAAGRWVERRVSGAVAREVLLGDGDVARLLWLIRVTWVRDAAWSLVRRADAERHVRLWTDIVRRSPEGLVAPPAALLGWSAWQAGDGARAWAAVDRCLAADPGYALAVHLSRILGRAVPPDQWDGGFDWTRGIPERIDPPAEAPDAIGAGG